MSTFEAILRRVDVIAVFCGSNTGLGERYIAAASMLGKTIGRRGLTLVYGGTNKGLMGLLANAVIEAGGKAHGVITQRLVDRGHQHPDLHICEVVRDMRGRKARMAELADAFIALPGGIGTLEEFMEIWTLNQLGELDKPAGLFDVGGYYQPFLGFIDHMIAERFLPAEHRQGVVVQSDADMLIDGLLNFQRVMVPKWL